jgi:phenylpyruvate tautomerase PptA (4-oxalocrotonate tautomerase family)
MAQIKIYGLKAALDPIKARLSDIVHSCVVDVLELPADKRFHRFIALDPDDFRYPSDRSERYLIVEISIFSGRTTVTKKRLIQLLFKRLHAELDLLPQDVEITIFETPKANWGIRGKPGDELELSYTVEV